MRALLPGPVLLFICDNCTVFETGNFPAGQGGTKEHVTDLFGWNNNVVGFAKNTIEAPKGIGQTIRGVMEGVGTKVTAQQYDRRRVAP